MNSCRRKLHVFYNVSSYCIISSMTLAIQIDNCVKVKISAKVLLLCYFLCKLLTGRVKFSLFFVTLQYCRI